MRASELIEALRREIEIHGDLDVVYQGYQWREVETIKMRGQRLELAGRSAREL